MKTRTMVLAIIATLSLAAWGQDDLATWAKYKTIAVNTTASGANVSGNVENFPLLVRLNADNAEDIFAEAGAGGMDIRFASASGVQRPYEIELWDSTAQQALIWVLADTVKGDDSVATLRIYWGRDEVSAASDGEAVFDTANGFVAVWHMNGTTTETDVTANAFVASPTAAPGTSDSAAIGAGRSFDGTQYFRVEGSASGALNFAMDASYTLSAWVRADSVSTAASTGHGIINKGDHQWTLAVWNRWYETTTKAGNNQWRQATTEAANIALDDHTGTWKYVTGTWTGSPTDQATGRIYLDGVLINTETYDNTSTAGRNEDRDVHIGVLSNEGTGSTEPTGSLERYWIGVLDEIRVSSVARSDDWIKLEYETQKSDAASVILGETQTQSTALASASMAASDLSVTQMAGAGMLFHLQDAGNPHATLSLVDIWGRIVWRGSFANGRLVWDGRVANGAAASSGAYIARVTVRDAQGKVTQVFDRRIPYMR
jgi:hypothetical protein